VTEKWASIEEAVAYAGEDRVVHFTDYLLAKAGTASRSQNFKSGFQSFDAKTGGIETGEVVVVTGYTKNGKTLFAESWIKRMMDRDPSAKAALFSFEIQPEKMLAKYVANDQAPLYLPLQLQTMDFEWLRKKCAEAKYKHNCRIVLIDHLHFLVDMATKQNMSLNIGAFMRNLKKEIAMDLNLAVILIAHQGQAKEGKDASLEGIRDSSFVAQESDATIVVSRQKNFSNVELKEYAAKLGEEAVSVLTPPMMSDLDDQFSSGLAIVKIEVHRRTGVYRWKKLFQKRGDFLEEV